MSEDLVRLFKLCVENTDEIMERCNYTLAVGKKYTLLTDGNVEIVDEYEKNGITWYDLLRSKKDVGRIVSRPASSVIAQIVVKNEMDTAGSKNWGTGNYVNDIISSGVLEKYKTYGFLARHSVITADVSEKCLYGWREKYFKRTKKWPDESRGFLIVSDDQKWNFQNRIWFPEPVMNVVWPTDIVVQRNQGRSNISNNMFVWELFGLGFGLRSTGHNAKEIRHNLESIEGVPKEALEYFEEGLRRSIYNGEILFDEAK